jgi:hypothetical protein
MKNINRIKMLTRAQNEFNRLSVSSRRKYYFFRFLDIFIKATLAICGALITYSSDEKSGFGNNFMKAMGIIIAGFTALSGVFGLEKHAHSNCQIHGKCKHVLPDIEKKLLLISESDENSNIVNDEAGNIQEYIDSIFEELSKMSLSSYTDSAHSKITENHQ